VATTFKRAEDIQEVLAQACARKELLILVTPYLRFESAFVALEPGELHVQATMSREDANFGLRTPELMMRFPAGLGFLEAPVRTLGLGIHNGRRTLRLSIPKEMQENDQRSAYRVERVGRVVVTYGTPKGDIQQAALVDISTQGARIHTQRDVDPTVLPVGTKLALSIPLLDEIRIEARAEIRHLGGARTVGLKFLPSMPKSVEVPLSRWVFQRREEDRERLAMRMEAKDKEDRAKAAPADKPAGGILLVSADADLETELRTWLQPVQPLVRVAPNVQSLKDTAGTSPSLAIIHIAGAGLDERKRVKGMVDLVQGRCPILLLGTLIDGATLFELSGEWKTASALAWMESRGAFLQKLAQGIIRRHSGGGDSPIAPKEG